MKKKAEEEKKSPITVFYDESKQILSGVIDKPVSKPVTNIGSKDIILLGPQI